MDVSLPADLAQLKARFEQWRKNRKARSPIPQDLLQAARDLLDRYKVGTVCRACRLHPTSLKRPGSSRAKPAKPALKPARKTQTAFFSLPPTSLAPEPPVPVRLPAQDCRLVLERPDGARMTLVLPKLDAAALATLCSNFLRS